MSPRSDELFAGAREWLRAAEVSLEAGHASGAAGNAYYAMLYAARAALSEEDRYAKTHNGVWTLFADLFVRTGRFDRALYSTARDAETRRLSVHYDAVILPEADGRIAVDDARRFVEAVAAVLAE